MTAGKSAAGRRDRAEERGPEPDASDRLHGERAIITGDHAESAERDRKQRGEQQNEDSAPVKASAATRRRA